MVRNIARVMYLGALLVVIGQVVLGLVPDGVQFHGDEGPTERLVQATLTAVAVREVAAGSIALWQEGCRWLKSWRRKRRVKGQPEASPSDADLATLAEAMFPQPGMQNRPSWLEDLALVAIKNSLRGLFSLLPESACVQLYLQVRWRIGRSCPHCGGKELDIKDPHYRQYWQRYTCPTCSAAKGKEVTFTDLKGTLMEGSHLELRLWLWGGLLFVSGCSTQEIARELCVSYPTARRMVTLFQMAYLTQRFHGMLTGPVEIDEVYIVGGLKGGAGGIELDRPARCRGLKKRGRGTWDTDKVPVLGLVDRQGQVYLLVCANVQTKTIQPFVEHLVTRGATVYTDKYAIYNFLRRLGYKHDSVNHSQGEYARGEVHVNTVEGLWSLLRDHLRIHRGVSKVYLPLYVGRFEFLRNRRGQTRWEQLVDLLALSCRADGGRLRRVYRKGQVSKLCTIPGLAGA